MPYYNHHCGVIEAPQTQQSLLRMGLYLFICVFAIVLYGTYRCRSPQFEDPFTHSVVGDHPLNKYIDGWGLLHFWFFTTLAYWLPNCWAWLIVAGVLWEVVEMMFREHPFYFTKCDAAVEENKDGWWYGRWQDLVMNALGVWCGLALRQYGLTQPKMVFPLGFVLIGVFQVLVQQVRKKKS